MQHLSNFNVQRHHPMIVLNANCINMQISRLEGERDSEFLARSAGSRNVPWGRRVSTTHLVLFPRKGLVQRLCSVESRGTRQPPCCCSIMGPAFPKSSQNQNGCCRSCHRVHIQPVERRKGRRGRGLAAT